MLKTFPIYKQPSQRGNHAEQLLYDSRRIIVYVLFTKERSEKITIIEDRQIFHLQD
jgi:hypothetical protein